MPKTDQILAIPFLLLLIFPVVGSKQDCPASFCGNNSLPVQYPFRLQGENDRDDCNYALNLTCSDADGVLLIDLPYLGDLYVRTINYSTKVIQLYDTNTNCLASRFLSAGISYSSALMAESCQNFTFFGCPPGNLSSSNYTAIGCLSNSTLSVFVTTSSISGEEQISSLGCSVIVSIVPLPVSWPLQYVFDGDLTLTWSNGTTFNACADKQRRHRGVSIMSLFFLCLTLPIVSGFLLYGLIWSLVYSIPRIKRIIACVANQVAPEAQAARDSNEINLVTPRPQPPPRASSDTNRVDPPYAPAAWIPRLPAASSVSVTAGSGDYNGAVDKFKRIRIGGSRRIPGPNSTACPICLEEYNPAETMKSIVKCGHCFHESCIDRWLSAPGSCPVCRATPG